MPIGSVFGAIFTVSIVTWILLHFSITQTCVCRYSADNHPGSRRSYYYCSLCCHCYRLHLLQVNLLGMSLSFMLLNVQSQFWC